MLKPGLFQALFQPLRVHFHISSVCSSKYDSFHIFQFLTKYKNAGGQDNKISVIIMTETTLCNFLETLVISSPLGQLHVDVILLQLPESLSLLFSCAN